VPDLWQILGYDGLIDRLSEGLSSGDGIQLIIGPPGVGKSSLAEEIGGRWESAGGVALVAMGDSGRGDSPYYPFNYALGGMASRWKSVAPVAYGAGRVAEALIGTRGTITSTVEALAELPGKRRQRRSKFLGESAQQALHNLERRAKKKPTLLIADNLHWWDRGSLDLLRVLLSAEMLETFPFIERIRVLAVETVATYQQVLNPSAHDAVLAAGRTRRVELQRPPRERFREVLLALGAPETLDRGVADEIYTLSGGHLLLARRAAQFVASRDVTSLFSDADPDEFQRVLLTERIYALGNLGRETVQLLQVASALGLTFRQDEILCAYGGDESDTRRLLRSCREEQVLAFDDQTYRFVHDVLRQFFGRAAGMDPVSVHERLMSCMRVLQPASYAARCANALSAERPRDAGVFAVQAALQCEREGIDWRGALTESVRRALMDAGFAQTLELLMAGWEALVQYRFVECQRLLSQLPHGLPESLIAEADYVRGMCLMSTRSEDDRERGRGLLRAWAGFEDKEPELGLRLMRQLLYGLAMLRDKTEARGLEHRIRVTLESRVAFDPSAIDDLYILDRCSGALDTPDLALVRTREAMRHFAPSPGDIVTRRPVEYYRCLVNFGANLICNAEYQAAVDVYDRLAALIAEYGDGVFPRTDYPYSNGLLAQYRHGLVPAAQAALNQREIIVASGTEADPFYPHNALAVYLTLAGEFNEALVIFDELARRLDSSRRDPEPSMRYLVGSNRVVARSLAGVTDDAVGEWRALTPLLANNAYTTAPYLERRHELMAEVLASANAMSPEQFDRYVVTRYPDEFGPLWDNYGRGFRMPEVEFWRES